MALAIPFRDDERELFDRELDDFVPPVVFDAHAHLGLTEHWPPDRPTPQAFDDLPPCLGLAEYRARMGELLPDRRVDGLFIPSMLLGDPETINAFVADEIRDEPRCRGAIVVRPEMDPDYVKQEVHARGAVGLKCYHLFARRKDPDAPTWGAEIPEYLPEPIVEVADELGLTITLHMVKDRALADEANQQAIRTYCRRYPNSRMILAHAGRGFNPHHTIEGVGALAGLENLWFDTSAVTDGGAIEAILETFGHERVLYGSDFHVSHFRGRCVAIGDSFLWIYEDTVDWSKTAYTDLKPVAVGLESLRCLKLAARHARLGDAQVEDIFFGNAARLFGLG